jgi:hypothetical protein
MLQSIDPHIVALKGDQLPAHPVAKVCSIIFHYWLSGTFFSGDHIAHHRKQFHRVWPCVFGQMGEHMENRSMVRRCGLE